MPSIDPDLERPQDAELHLMQHLVTLLPLDGKATDRRRPSPPRMPPQCEPGDRNVAMPLGPWPAHVAEQGPGGHPGMLGESRPKQRFPVPATAGLRKDPATGGRGG